MDFHSFSVGDDEILPTEDEALDGAVTEHDDDFAADQRESDVGDERGDNVQEGREPGGSCIILIGATGAGKSTVGWYLARGIGYGFIDLDKMIERRAKKTINAIFEERGEAQFRDLETAELAKLANARSQVIAVGGGAAEAELNWEALTTLGTTVWLNPPPSEIARRLLADDVELKKRPLLADVLAAKASLDRAKLQELLTVRLTALLGQRQERYKQARVIISDAFSTPESTARLIRDELVRDGTLKSSPDQRTFDRWRIM